MEVFTLVLELIGTVSFAASGAMVAVRKRMDVFGVIILGIVTAVGGGVIRDMLLGITPPVMFQNPLYALVAAATAAVVFIPAVRRFANRETHHREIAALITDSVGLGIFAVVGVQAGILAGHGDNLFFIVFLGSVTGVGGGVLRDVMAVTKPYIFVKHVYALAAIAGALVCALLWKILGSTLSMLLGTAVVIALRLLAAKFKWSLPKAVPEEE